MFQKNCLNILSILYQSLYSLYSRLFTSCPLAVFIICTFGLPLGLFGVTNKIVNIQY